MSALNQFSPSTCRNLHSQIELRREDAGPAISISLSSHLLHSVEFLIASEWSNVLIILKDYKWLWRRLYLEQKAFIYLEKGKEKRTFTFSVINLYKNSRGDQWSRRSKPKIFLQQLTLSVMSHLSLCTAVYEIVMIVVKQTQINNEWMNTSWDE